jgi:hypothetical protein
MKEITLKKPRAKTTIIFKPDPKDDWFIDVIQFETKSGKETSRHLIIGSDVEQWKKLFISEGWSEVDMTKEVKKEKVTKKKTTKVTKPKAESKKPVGRKKKNPDN